MRKVKSELRRGFPTLPRKEGTRFGFRNVMFLIIYSKML
jgi:hypothetical protein